MDERDEDLIVALATLSVIAIALGALVSSPSQCNYTCKALANDLEHLPFHELATKSKEKQEVKNEQLTQATAIFPQKEVAKNATEKKAKKYGLIRTCYYGAIQKIKQFYAFIY